MPKTFQRVHQFVAILMCGGAVLVPTAISAQPVGVMRDAERDEASEEEAAGVSGSDIVVTGSRIRRSSADSPSPVTVISAETIRSTGQSEIADVVNELPSLAITQSNQTSNLLGNAGLNALDLRGLGTQRTLVLVNGRRHVPAIPGTSAVDISTIPANLVERVEIVTGGASALYGADAVAGVANFILKKNFQGIDSTFRYGASTRGDMDDYSFDFLAGTNFADDRGNATLFAFYEGAPSTVSGQDRPWTAGGFPIYTRPNTSAPFTVVDNNRNIFAARDAQVLLGGKLYSFDSSGALRTPQLGPGGFVNLASPNLNDKFTLGTLLTDGGEYGGRYDSYYLSVPSDRFATHGSLSYEFSDALKFSLSGEYSRNKSQAAYAAFTAYGYDTVPVDSPFITSQMRAANGGAITAPLNFARRFEELGIARTKYDRQLVQFIAAVDGDFSLFSNPWNYSAYYSYGRTRQEVQSVNGTAVGRYYDGLDSTTDAAGNPICRSTLSDPGNGCVPINPFKPLTQQVIDHLQWTSSPAASTMSQHVASAYVGGGLFELPGGMVQAVLGAEYRHEKNDIAAAAELDPANPAFDPSIGFIETPLVGKYSVREVFGEVHVPILADVPFFQTLSVDGAVRLSDYSTAGSTTTYKVGGEWAPVDDIRFRATYGKAVRAPNIGELYTAGSVTPQYVTDPCNSYNVAFRPTKTQYTAANCAILNPSDKRTYWLYRDIITEGNLDLGVETAKTLTVGVVVQPRFIKNLALSVDYYNIDLRGAIDKFGAQALIDKCVDLPSLDNPFCPLVMRDAQGNIESVTTKKLNLSRFLTRGIDFELAYQAQMADLGLGPNSGHLSISAAYSRLLKRDYTLDPADPTNVTKSAGVFGSPKWKGVVRTTYDNGGFSATWAVRHFGPMKATSTATADMYIPLYTKDVFYHDFSASYWATRNISVFGGLRNAFDKAPPRIPGAEAGGANFEFGYQAGVYDVIGRTFFVGIRFVR